MLIVSSNAAQLRILRLLAGLGASARSATAKIEQVTGHVLRSSWQVRVKETRLNRTCQSCNCSSPILGHTTRRENTNWAHGLDIPAGAATWSWRKPVLTLDLILASSWHALVSSPRFFQFSTVKTKLSACTTSNDFIPPRLPFLPQCLRPYKKIIISKADSQAFEKLVVPATLTTGVCCRSPRRLAEQ